MEQFKKCNNPKCQQCPRDHFDMNNNNFIGDMPFEESYNEKCPNPREYEYYREEPKYINDQPCYPRDQPCPRQQPCYQREPPCPREQPFYPREQPCMPNKPLCMPNKPPCMPNNPPCMPNKPSCMPNNPPCVPNNPPCMPNRPCHGQEPPRHFQRNEITEDSDIFEPNYSDACVDAENIYNDQFSNDNNCHQHFPNNENQYHQHFPNGQYASETEAYMITDEYLLNYLLRKYKLDKYKLIASIKRAKDHENKMHHMKVFYKNNKFLIVTYRPFSEHWKKFKIWSNGNSNVSKEELQDYYDEYIRSKNG